MVDPNISGKKVLYIGPSFFGYEKQIEQTISELGAFVAYHDERPNTKTITKILIRSNHKGLISREINRHYSKILDEASSEQWDTVLIISPETIPEATLTQLRSILKKSTFVLYMWDSLGNKSTGYNVLKHFDRKYSFDPVDCEAHKDLKYLPLFYRPEYAEIPTTHSNYLNDIYTANSLHSDRYLVAKKLFSNANKAGLKTESFLYAPSRLVFIIQKLLDPSKLPKLGEVSFKAQNLNSTISKIRDTRALLDIHHPQQNGLTIRSIEALGANRKIISTNKFLLEHDFYHKNNISIIDRNNPKINLEFFRSDYIPPSKSIHRKYSIREWAKTLLSESP